MEFNIATGIFAGFNDSEGIMLCGYEWGEEDGKDESTASSPYPKSYPDCVFSNKASWPQYGNDANKWPYDRRIREWFKLWGHELKRAEGDFEKCLLQTNWCDTQGHHMEGDYQTKLLADEQVKNFIKHINGFRPKLIIFFGSSMINFLQCAKVLHPFVDIMGAAKGNVVFHLRPFSGRRFRVGFQEFERCKVISLPHPSGSRALSDGYIKLFSTEIGLWIQEIKEHKNIL
jgi:hypothetical protein